MRWGPRRAGPDRSEGADLLRLRPLLTLAHLELEAFLRALLAPARPWTIVRRRYRGNVFVPLYKRLDIELA